MLYVLENPWELAYYILSAPISELFIFISDRENPPCPSSELKTKYYDGVFLTLMYTFRSKEQLMILSVDSQGEETGMHHHLWSIDATCWNDSGLHVAINYEELEMIKFLESWIINIFKSLAFLIKKSWCSVLIMQPFF